MASDRLKTKIAALRAKTTAAGCTEAEALAAAELATRLMKDHGLSEAELVMTEARSRERTTTATWRSYLAAIIAEVTNTAVILESTGAFLFIGRAPGPEIAAYLRDVCVRAVETALRAFKAGTFYRRRRAVRTRRAAAADFTMTMARRLGARLRDLFADQRDRAAEEAAKRVLAARFPDTVTLSRRSRELQYSEAYWAGQAAGDRVALNHAMANEQSEAPRHLEHRRGRP